MRSTSRSRQISATAGPVPIGRRDNAAGTDHRLADERGHAAVQLVEDAGEVVRVVVRDLGDVTDERSVPVAYRRNTGERRPVRVRSVVREAARQHHRSLRLAQERPVPPRDLRGRVDRLATARSEEDRGVLDGREVGESRRELERRRVRVVAEDVVRGEGPQLLGNGIGDLRAAVPDVDEPEPCRRVDVLVPVDVPDAAAFATR